MQNIPKRECIICNKLFKPIRVNNLICPDIRCKYKRHRQQKDQWNIDNYVHIEKQDFKCPYCSSVTPLTRYDRKVCRSRKCVNKHNYQMKKRRKAGLYAL